MSTRGTQIKSNARYTCQECGSTEFIQAHHQIPKDDDSLIALCAICHSKKHPDLPLGLFFSINHQPYWHNKSASSLAKECGVHPRTIIRIALRLHIAKGILSSESETQIRQITAPRPIKIKVYKYRIENRQDTERIFMTLKSSHVQFLRERAKKYNISVSAVTDLIIEDFISQDKLRERVTARNIK